MSRSWERMVQRNGKKVNKQRKKQGKPSLTSQKQQGDRYLGRNFIFPALLVLLMVFYVIVFAPWRTPMQQDDTMFWITLGCYGLLAVFYYLRRPYLSISRDSLDTRKFTGYKTLRPAQIRKIVLSPGYVVIESVKGANWVFSKSINRYPIDRMSEKLKAFAETHNVEVEVKAK
jgi:hypothetical protein